MNGQVRRKFGESALRTITIQDKTFSEDESVPLWLVITIMDDAISIMFIMAESHKLALAKAKD